MISLGIAVLGITNLAKEPQAYVPSKVSSFERVTQKVIFQDGGGGGERRGGTHHSIRPGFKVMAPGNNDNGIDIAIPFCS